eukprot:gene13606-15018_t
MDRNQKRNLLELQTEHEHELQSISCLLLNKHAVNSDLLQCQQELYQIQDSFTKLFNVTPTDQDSTNSLLYRFQETRTAFADLQHPLRELNDAVDTQNAHMNKIRTKLYGYTSQMLATLTTYLAMWKNNHQKNATTYSETLPAQFAHDEKIVKKMQEFRDLLHEGPTHMSTLLAFMPNASVEFLEAEANEILTACLSYQAELCTARHAYFKLFSKLSQCHQKAATATQNLHDFFTLTAPESINTIPIHSHPNQTGVVKEKSKHNNKNTKDESTTRYSSHAPTLHKFRPMNDLRRAPLRKPYALESHV